MLASQTEKSDSPLDRAIAVLQLVASLRRSVSIAEIADRLEIPLPSAHRIVGNLEERNLLRRALGSKRLLVGNAMVDLATEAIGAAFRTARRHALLRTLSAEIGEQCEIGVVRDTVVTYVDSVRLAPSHGLQFDPGTMVPIHCTSTGKIYMSRMSRKAREKLVSSLSLHSFTPNTITDPDDLLYELEQTRISGWAKSNEEYVKGVVGCAVPITAADGGLVACLGVSVPQARVAFEELDQFIERLQLTASRLAETLEDEDDDDLSDAPAVASLNSGI